MYSYARHKEIFDLQERHENRILNTSKNFFPDNRGQFCIYFCNTFATHYKLTIYLLSKPKKIRVLIASLVLHQVKEVGLVSQETNSECRTLAYIGIILTILSLIIVTFLHYRKLSFCKGYRLSNAVKIIIFISEV